MLITPPTELNACTDTRWAPTTRPTAESTRSQTTTRPSARSSTTTTTTRRRGRRRRSAADDNDKLEHATSSRLARTRILSSETREANLNDNQMQLLEAFKTPANHRHHHHLSAPSLLLLLLVAAALIVSIFAASPGSADSSRAEPNEGLQMQLNAAQWEFPAGASRFRHAHPSQQQHQLGHHHHHRHSLARLVHQPSVADLQNQQQHLQHGYHLQTNNQRSNQQQQQAAAAASLQEALAMSDQQVDNDQRRLVHLLHSMEGAAQASQQSPAYWTGDLWSSASDQQIDHQAAVKQQQLLAAASSEHHHHHHQQQRVSPAGSGGGGSPTTPTISRQLIAPPPFYELGLAPANAIQLEVADTVETPTVAGREHIRGLQAAEAQRSLTNAGTLTGEQGDADQRHLISGAIIQRMTRHNGTARSNEHFDGDHQAPANGHPSDSNVNKNQGDDQNINVDKASSSESSAGGEQLPPVVDKSIEPRQRRRIFNRILKKAEWNHLFVELSKVFLRYFLDLALKDIIGKQSGTGGGDSTTSRKKLDAQSELADLLKDFVKTAISNI